MTDLQQSVARALVANMHAQVGCERLARVPGEVFSTIEATEHEIDMREMAQSAIEAVIRGLIADGASEAVVGAWLIGHPECVESIEADQDAKADWKNMLIAKAKELGIQGVE